MMRRTSGFTLMEILLAIAITGFVMAASYATLFATIKARDQIERESLNARVGPAILDLIEKDITCVWSLNIHDNDVFYGEHRTINGVPADQFHMLTCTDSTIVEMNGDEPVRSDISEVSYRLRDNPSNPELLELYRRQDFHADEKIAEDGIYELIYSRIKSIQVFYYKDLYEGSDRYEEWDAKVRNRLPACMEITLSLEIDPRLAGYSLEDMERPVQNFRRVIFFPQGSEVTMAVRPVIPTFVEPQGGGDTGGGAGGSGGGAGGAPPGGGEGDGKGGMPGMGDGKPPGPGDGFAPPPDLPPPEFPGKPPLPPPNSDMDLNDLLNMLGGWK